MFCSNFYWLALLVLLALVGRFFVRHNRSAVSGRQVNHVTFRRQTGRGQSFLLETITTRVSEKWKVGSNLQLRASSWKLLVESTQWSYSFNSGENFGTSSEIEARVGFSISPTSLCFQPNRSSNCVATFFSLPCKLQKKLPTIRHHFFKKQCVS